MFELKLSCDICGQPLAKKRLFHKSADTGASDAIFLYDCKGCGSEVLRPQPSNSLLAEEYKEYFERRTKYTDVRFPKEAFFTELLKEHFGDLKDSPNLNVLELGAGSGDFVHAFNKLFPRARITAVDMNQEGAANYEGLNCTLINRDIIEYTKASEEEFDIIFMFDVVEHMRNPMELLRCCKERLAPGARVCFSTPLAGAGLHKITGRFWPQYKLEHTFYLSNKSFGIIAKTLELKVERAEVLKKRLPISYLLSVGSNFGPRLFSLIVRVVKPFIPRFIFNYELKLSLGEAIVIFRKDSK
ncbi:MAG: class I SAM-dependent methyltransferase [Proteobacteria bacterium]|nr:class I SAM-dependent methyltransferase [Pseudomonadota bacterium]